MTPGCSSTTRTASACSAPGGGGSVAHFGLDADDVPVLVGTLGKAFGSFGAFVAGSARLIELLMQRARTYIYTTALPPAGRGRHARRAAPRRRTKAGDARNCAADRAVPRLAPRSAACR